MTKKEAAKLLAIMQANYYDSMRNMTDEAIMVVVELWAKVFANDSFESVSAAVMAHMATDTNRFMPPVGVIKNMLVKINSPAEMTEGEAWGYVSKALRNSIYNAEKEFEKLPDAVQRVVGSPNQLREWAAVDLAELQTVIASNFQRSFRARVASDKEYRALPDNVKSMIEGGVRNEQIESLRNISLRLGNGNSADSDCE
jgi:hypothetical protein